MSKGWYTEDESENDYLEKYIDSDDIYVFHKTLMDGIEISDLITFDDDNVYLIHVKKGFDGKWRVLTRQVRESARKVGQKDLNGNEDFFKEYYNSKNRGKDTSEIDMTEDEFAGMFINRNINYILAFADTSSRDLVDDFYAYKSNYAKYAVAEIFDNFQMFDLGLYIHQIGNNVDG